ncbi:MAG: calcium-binding protein, partial [Haliea sp.]
AGRGGVDILDGGAGQDTAVFAGAFASYTVTRPSAGDVTFSGLGETATVRNVESFQFSDGTRTLGEVVGNTASPFNDELTGTPDNDLLDGLAGADILIGGLGDDVYVVDNAGDLVVELANEGTDAVNVVFTVAGTYTLPDHVENATVTASFIPTWAPTPAPAPAPGTGGLDPALLALLGLGGAQAPAPAPAAGGQGVNLTGNALNNILRGNAGANVLTGKAGDDTYVINSAADTVVEALNEGTDQVHLAFTVAGGYTLSTNVENASITTGTAGVNITGNAEANVLLGNAAANTLTGAAGNDTLAGQGGADTIDGGADSDTVVLAGAFAAYTITRPNATDVVLARAGETVTVRNVESFQFADSTRTLGGVIGNTASPFNDDLTGTAGNDTLDGLAGADMLAGGLGDDTYVVDNPSDVIIELLNEGTEQVNVAFTAAGTYTLSANVENATVTAAASASAPSPAPAPSFGGLDPALLALLGLGGAPAPAPAPAGAQSVNLTGNALNNVLTGNAAANTLTGGLGNDTLDGGGGNDTLVGGQGDDTYRIDATGDVVTELANEGMDQVQVLFAAAGTYTLGTNVESATVVGAAIAPAPAPAAGPAIGGLDPALLALLGLTPAPAPAPAGNQTANLTGNALDNILIGNGSANSLNGGAGNDLLDGGGLSLSGFTAGDLLTGGTGQDTFRFSSAINGPATRIADFMAADDTIQLDNAIFAALADGALGANAFQAGTQSTAGAADVRIILNTSTGGLFYDADGAGGADAVQFATVDLVGLVGPITAADFLVG